MKNCIVVLNYNDSERTLKFIDDIKKYTTVDEIIVVDNCSTDDSCDKLKKVQNDKITLLQAKKNRGYGAGNNLGCKYAIEKYNNPIIFISNPDIVVEEKVICDMINYLKNNNDIAVVAPNILQDGQIEKGWKLLTPIRGAILNLPFVYRVLKKQKNRNYFYSNEDYQNKETVVDVVTGCFFAIKGEVMNKINYFDENVFLYNEEEIIAKKVKELGLKTILLNNISVIHEHSISINKSFSSINKIKLANKSKIYYQKNYNNANKFEILLWHFVNEISILKEYIKIIFNKVFGGKYEKK